MQLLRRASAVAAFAVLVAQADAATLSAHDDEFR